MHLKLKVRKEYKKYAKDLKAAQDRVKAGDCSGATEIQDISCKIINKYEDKIQKIWNEHPEIIYMGFKFELNDVFLGERFHSMIKEAEQKYEDKNFEPLLDYVIGRYYPDVMVI